MQELGRRCPTSCRVYFTGGVTAVLSGWRESTIDIDMVAIPEVDALLRSLPELKESLHINIELASPAHFVPELPGWESRSLFIGQEQKVSFYHYDLYSQALSKIERGHAQDVKDVQDIFASGNVDRETLRKLFKQIESQLYRYPAIDPKSLRKAVEEATK